MSHTELREFLVQRLLTLDPNLEDAPGSPMYQAVIDPLLRRLGTDPLRVDIEAFLTDRFASDPLLRDIDIYTEGSAYKDTLFRALIVALEPLQREIQSIKAQQSLRTGNALAEGEADLLLSNLGIARNLGTLATGLVRVYFASPRSVSVDASIVFGTPEGLQFVPSYPQAKAPGEFVREGSTYYVEFEVQSTVAHKGASVAEDKIRLQSGLTDVLRVTNPSRMTGGSSAQTVEEATATAQDAISERALNTRKGIRALLRQFFPDIESVEVVGFGDPEMQRDVIRGEVLADFQAGPGEVLATAGTVRGWTLTNPGGSETRTPDSTSVLSNWNGTNHSFHTNVVVFTYSSNEELREAVARIDEAVYVRVFHISTQWDKQLLGLPRKIRSYTYLDASFGVLSSLTNAALSIRFILEDFSIVVEGSNATTAPHKHSISDQGSAYALVTENDWRGAPLPFTDLVTLSGGSDLSGYTAIEGRDYLVLRGVSADSAANGAAYRVFPVRSKVSASQLRVHRADSYLCQSSALGGVLSWVADKNKMFWADSPFVKAFGAPSIGNPAADSATMFDGSTTVDEGIVTHGGVALYIPYGYSGTPYCWVRVATNASRPEGWKSLGVSVGDFISLAAFSGETVSPTKDKLFDWWSWGRVVQVGSPETSPNYHYLKVYGLNTAEIIDGATTLLGMVNAQALFSGLVAETAWGFPSTTPYRLHWAVYRGEQEAVLPNNNIHPVYPEFAYPYAYTTSGETVDATAGKWCPALGLIPGIDGGPDPSAYDYDQPCLAYGASVTGLEGGAGYAHRQHWAIFRLAEEWLTRTLEDGTTLLAQHVLSTDYVTISNDLHTAARYQDVTDISIRVLQIPQNGPFGKREWQWTGVGSPDVELTNSGLTENYEDISGVFLTPRTGSISGKNFGQLLAERQTPVSSTSLTLASVPGAYPFTAEFVGPLKVENDAIHIGGCVDIFVKGATEPRESVSFKVSASDLTLGGDVLLSDSGHVTSTAPNSLYSATFGSAYTALTLAELVFAVVEITAAPDPTLVGKAYVILGTDHSASSIRVGESLNDTGLLLPNISFRIYRSATCNAVTPYKIVAEGTDLQTTPESLVAYSASGFTFTLVTGTHYLEILSGDNKGLYPILNVAGGSITTREAFPHAALDQHFRVVSLGTGVSLPVIRVASLATASSEGVGIKVPYRHPVDLEAGVFSSLNNDPLVENLGRWIIRPSGTYAGSGGSGEDPSHAAGTFGTATLFSSDSALDWTQEGIVDYDVVRVLVDGVFQYYWVLANNAGPSGHEGRVLTLAGDVSGVLTGLSGVIGKPSVGTVRAYFLGRTYAEFSATETVMQNTEISVRPSPVESSIIFGTSSAEVGHVLTPLSTTAATLRCVSQDYQALGVRVGDTVRISTRVITSSVISGAVDADLSAIAGKTLNLVLGGVPYPIRLQAQAGTLTLTKVVALINSVFGSLLSAKREASSPGYVLKLSTRQSLSVADSSAGVLSALGLTQGETNSYVSTSMSQVTGIAYNETTQQSTLTLADSDGNPSFSVILGTVPVHFDVLRYGVQIFYPSDMQQDSTGLYYVDVTCSSRAPLTERPAGKQLSLSGTGYRTLGYELSTDNPGLSFSAAEVLMLSVTGCFLPEWADSFVDVMSLPESTLTLEYDRSALVEAAQAVVLSDSHRVPDTNPLVRHFFPGYFYFNVQVEGGKSADEIRADIMTLLARKYPNKPVTGAELERVLLAAGATRTSANLVFFFVVHDEDRSIRMIRPQTAAQLPDFRYHVVNDASNVVITT